MTALLNPRVWLAVILAAFLAFTHFSAYRSGRAAVRTEFDAYKLSQQESARKAALARAKAQDAAATSHEQFKAQEEIRYVDRIKIVRQLVDRPVYRNVCVDPDGLRELNAAIRGAGSSQPAPAVPAAAKP